MTQEHLTALITAAEAKKNDDGWIAMPDGRAITLYVGSNQATLTVARIQALRLDSALLHARTQKGEHYVLALQDVFAGSVEAPAGVAKKAGFL